MIDSFAEYDVPPLLSLVVPCFNEEEVIPATHARLAGLTRQWEARNSIRGCEIIYVDDGSRDGTLDRLKIFAGEDPRVKVLSFSGNFGHQAALSAGLHHASGDAVVSLDADLQDPPEVIETMLERYREGFDVVCGARNDRRKDSLFKRVTAQSFYKMMQAMGVKVVYNHADFRLLSRKVVSEFERYSESNRFLRGLIPAMGFRHCVVEYVREERQAGETKYPLRKMLAFALDGITSFSYLPLRFASIAGFLTFVVAFGLGIWALVTKMTGAAIPGWASTVLPIYFLGGIQLMFLGVMGEYLGKMYMEVKKRPLYIVKERLNFSLGMPGERHRTEETEIVHKF